mmetsp:Transcript_36873/g.83143  ORF Transcript_36873/g.83143 Transcript_36873/m.83143 type:complete len:85 (+) Transcript_36873:405-659(+)
MTYMDKSQRKSRKANFSTATIVLKKSVQQNMQLILRNAWDMEVVKEQAEALGQRLQSQVLLTRHLLQTCGTSAPPQRTWDRVAT